MANAFHDEAFIQREVGSIHPGQDGAILAHGTTPEDLELRVKADPFVEHDVVTAEILEIAPGAADERLSFLLS